MSLSSLINIEKADPRFGPPGKVKGGRALLTTAADPEARDHDKYFPAEGRFVFTTREGLATHFAPMDDNEVEAYVGQIINTDSNGVGDEASKLSSLVVRGENLYDNNCKYYTIPNGTKFVVVPTDFYNVFGLAKDANNKTTRLNALTDMYHPSVKPVKGLYPPLVLPMKAIFEVAGLVVSTKHLWVRSTAGGSPAPKNDALTKITKLAPNPNEPVTLASAPALFITAVRRLVGATINSSDDATIDSAINGLLKNTAFETSLNEVIRAHHVWISAVPTLISSTTVVPGGRGSCIS